MPRFYFHFLDDVETRDEEGREFADAYAAHQQAVLEAREMAAESVQNGKLVLSHRVEVTDQSSSVLFQVRFEDVVHVSA